MRDFDDVPVIVVIGALRPFVISPRIDCIDLTCRVRVCTPMTIHVFPVVFLLCSRVRFLLSAIIVSSLRGRRDACVHTRVRAGVVHSASLNLRRRTRRRGEKNKYGSRIFPERGTRRLGLIAWYYTVSGAFRAPTVHKTGPSFEPDDSYDDEIGLWTAVR